MLENLNKIGYFKLYKKIELFDKETKQNRNKKTKNKNGFLNNF